MVSNHILYPVAPDLANRYRALNISMWISSLDNLKIFDLLKYDASSIRCVSDYLFYDACCPPVT
jgi:hypothetical protein